MLNGFFRRMGVVTIDQAISGLSNFAISLLAARLLGVADFGYFAAVGMVYASMIALSRAVVTSPLFFDLADVETKVRDVVGAAVALGAFCGVVIAGVAVPFGLAHNPLGAALAVMAIGAPLLLLQDAGRYAAIALDRAWLALLSDGMWLVLAVGGLFVVSVEGWHSVGAVTLLWVATGAVSAFTTFAMVEVRGFRLGLDWLRHNRGISGRNLVAIVAAQGSGLGTASMLGSLLGPWALAIVQGGGVLFRPFSMVQASVQPLMVADVAGARPARRRIDRAVQRGVLVLTAVALGNGAILFLVPHGLGHGLLGQTWAFVSPYLWPLLALYLLAALTTGFQAALWGVRELDAALWIDLMNSALLILATAVGALWLGFEGTLWLRAGSQAAVVPLWLWAYQRSAARREAPETQRVFA